MPTVGFQFTITAIEQQQFYTSNARQTGSIVDTVCIISTLFLFSTLVFYAVLFCKARPFLFLLLLFHFQFTFPALPSTTIRTHFLQKHPVDISNISSLFIFFPKFFFANHLDLSLVRYKPSCFFVTAFISFV